MLDIQRIQSLISAIQSKSLIIFVGAGLSNSVGLPNWKNLVIKILDRLDEDQNLQTLKAPLQADALSPIDVLRVIEDKDHKNIVYKVLNEQLNNIPNNSDLTLHKKVASISEKIITTNYDRLLELANPNITVVQYKSKFSVSALSRSEKFIFKLHGSIEQVEDCILFQSQYDEYYNEMPAPLLELFKMFSDKTLLFVGFSMSDPYINKLFKHIENLYGNNIEKHYIITTKPNDFKQFKYLKPIEINSYGDLSICFDELITLKNNVTSKVEKTHIAIDRKTTIAVLYASPIDKILQLIMT